MSEVRVRFAPSPTGALHIGGIRTALYNYLFAKKNKGTFILRIEDTDQTRYVPGAEEYIIEALKWLNLLPDEGVGFGGEYGPYRQSDRKDIYKKYADQLIASGHAYYAFDTLEELQKCREEDSEFKYSSKTRNKLKNSLTLSAEDVESRLKSGEHSVVRLRIPEDETVSFDDVVRGTVSFDSNELDDKVILKGDGLPTYHLANIVDDHLMKTSHVIRGEEWLSSTPHHVLMYRFFDWQPPKFAHLPLILKPTGKGKLSKRDGAKFGFPVFPLSWKGDTPKDSFVGFKEDGYLPEALVNFMGLLGWNPRDEQEILSVEEMIPLFDLEKIVKSGARFDIDKALWFNQQFIIKADDNRLASLIKDQVAEQGYHVSDDYLAGVCRLMKERVHRIHEIVSHGRFFFEKPSEYDDKTISKRYKHENKPHLVQIAENIKNTDNGDFETAVKGYISEHQLKMGEFLPLLRIAITGSMQGPDIIETISWIGAKESGQRLLDGIEYFESLNA